MPVRSTVEGVNAAVESKTVFMRSPVHAIRRRHELVEHTLRARLFSQIITSRSGSSYGSGRRRIASTAEKMAALAPDTERQRHDDRDDRHARLADEEPHRMLPDRVRTRRMHNLHVSS